MRLLYHCACAEGGLAEYALQQAASLSALPGVEVFWQAPAALGVPKGVQSVEPLVWRGIRKTQKIARAAEFIRTTVQPMHALAREARRTKPDAILLATWHEYLAPLWAPALLKLRRQGIRIGAVIHDPVRDYALGPAWWHHWSVREAYSFVDVAFTHDAVMPETYGCKHHFQLVQIPHGPYTVPDGCSERDDLRRQLGLPTEAKVLLSFGHIRDGKNLDQIISALPLLPEVHLLVAGREQSQGQRAAGPRR
jgi:glycosyltransferase involved in cell wall biosynthesis